MTRRARRAPRPLTAAQVLALAPFAWWKAEDLALADGAAVASWADASGNARALTQATGSKQPTYATTGLNGLPAVRFSSATVSALATATFTAAPPPYTVLVIGKAPATTPAATQYLVGGSSNGTRRDLYYTPATVFGMQSALGVQGTATAPASTSTPPRPGSP